jgi:uncharacterized protein
MVEFLAAFVTGLTAGGLSCLAVQGGLLTGSIAPTAGAQGKVKKTANRRSRAKQRSRKAQPVAEAPTARTILLFLAAKLVAYAVLGLLIGALGSMLQLTPTMSAILMLVIGVFMVGNGLRMLNVHPIFRYFTFEPPSVVTRYLRRKAKGGATAVTPLFLGALTVLIPCGVTQAMMALAMGTGDMLRAMGLMVAFTLGSSIIFFIVAYLALRLGGVMEKGFAQVAAVVLLVLGFVSVNSGLNVLGAPLPFLHPGRTAAQEAEPVIVETAEGEDNVITIAALPFGYAPRVVHARAGVPTRLTFVSEELFSCARALVIREWNIQQILPETGEFSVDLPAQPMGKVLNYSCSMGMYTGQIIFDQ